MSQVVALSTLAEALDALFNEAADLLPKMIQAYKSHTPLPRRDPSVIMRVCAALSFVENDKPQFLTLAHLDEDGKVSYRTEETLVWIAFEAATCEALEDRACSVRWRRGFFSRFRGESVPEEDDTIVTGSIHLLMRNTQNIALRAAFLANFIRHAIEHISRPASANVFEGSKEAAQRYLETYQRQLERIAPDFVDRNTAVDVIKSMSMPFTPIIISQIEDDTCKKLNGIPMTKEHAAAWRNYLGKMQGSSQN